MAVTEEGSGVTLGAVSPRGPSATVSSRTAVMEIVWSGLIEAINHHLPGLPPTDSAARSYMHTV